MTLLLFTAFYDPYSEITFFVHTQTFSCQIRVDRKSKWIMLKKVGGRAKAECGRKRKIHLLSPGPTIWGLDGNIPTNLFSHCEKHCLYSKSFIKVKVQSVHKQKMNLYPQKIPQMFP